MSSKTPSEKEITYSVQVTSIDVNVTCDPLNVLSLLPKSTDQAAKVQCIVPVLDKELKSDE